MNNLFFDREWPEKYAVIDIEDYDKLKVILEIVERVKEAEITGVITIDAAKKGFDYEIGC